MRMIKNVLLACAFIGSLGWTATAPAADKLPDTRLAGAAPMSAQEGLKKDAVCTGCHDESEATPILSIYQTKHGVRGDSRSPTCQSCHGESLNHTKGDPKAKTKGRASPDIVYKNGSYESSDDRNRAGACLTCHKGTKRTNWDNGQHESNAVACNDCHRVHQPADKVLAKKTQPEVCFTCHKEQRAQSKNVSTHPIEAGKVVCSDCHNPHGSPGPKLLKKATVTETCFTCHAEKRGPFLFEHQPVAEDCANCHTPHGSNISPLLKSRAPFLCQECHDGPHVSRSPVGTKAAGKQVGLALTAGPSENDMGRGCQNCHSMVHGTNHPAGAFLHR